MVDFIDEVNEEIRRQRLTRFWQKMGRYIIAVSVVIVFVTVASVLLEKYHAERQEEAARDYLAAEKLRVVRQYPAAEAAFTELAKENADGYPALAQLKAASALREQEKHAEALAAYETLVANRKADAGLRALARVYAAQLKSEAKQPYAEIEALLKPLAEDKESSFSSIAKEQLAVAAYAAGDVATARSLLEGIDSDLKAGAGMRQRAIAQLGVLTQEHGGPAEATSVPAE